jgi:hypothetical protein
LGYQLEHLAELNIPHVLAGIRETQLNLTIRSDEMQNEIGSNAPVAAGFVFDGNAPRVSGSPKKICR